jgi:hypothetical protein
MVREQIETEQQRLNNRGRKQQKFGFCDSRGCWREKIGCTVLRTIGTSATVLRTIGTSATFYNTILASTMRSRHAHVFATAAARSRLGHTRVKIAAPVEGSSGPQLRTLKSANSSDVVVPQCSTRL